MVIGKTILSPEVERVFKDLNALITDGKFTKTDADFMEKYLTKLLEIVKKMKERALN